MDRALLSRGTDEPDMMPTEPPVADLQPIIDMPILDMPMLSTSAAHPRIGTDEHAIEDDYMLLDKASDDANMDNACTDNEPYRRTGTGTYEHAGTWLYLRHHEWCMVWYGDLWRPHSFAWHHDTLEWLPARWTYVRPFWP